MVAAKKRVVKPAAKKTADKKNKQWYVADMMDVDRPIERDFLGPFETRHAAEQAAKDAFIEYGDDESTFMIFSEADIVKFKMEPKQEVVKSL